MATKTQMITFILENTKQFEEPDLNDLSYKDVKKIYDDVELKEEVEAHNSKIELEEEKGDDGINVEEILSQPPVVETKPEEEFQQDAEDLDILKDVVEEVEWDYDNLSPNDKRLYRRTGIKRISKSKKYTRFGVETPRI